jgi:plastocyanin
MKRFVITISVDRGQTICEPVSVEVEPGDTVRWTSEDGAVAVDFRSNTPFTSTQIWAAGRDQLTAAAVVKTDVQPGTFRPTISIDGSVVAESLGDVVFPRRAKAPGGN